MDPEQIRKLLEERRRLYEEDRIRGDDSDEVQAELARRDNEILRQLPPETLEELYPDDDYMVRRAGLLRHFGITARTLRRWHHWPGFPGKETCGRYDLVSISIWLRNREPIHDDRWRGDRPPR